MPRWLCRRPKVLAYVLKTFFVPEKACAAPGSSAGPSAAQRWQIRHDLVFTKFDKAADQSPACSMLRWHPLEPQLLQPLLRTSEPGLFQMQPWANLLWLGLAAPLESFELVRTPPRSYIGVLDGNHSLQADCWHPACTVLR